MARTDFGNTLAVPVLVPESSTFTITRSGFDTGSRTFSIDKNYLADSLPDLEKADTDIVWRDRTGATISGTYGTMYVSGVSDITEGRNGICQYTVKYLGLIKSQKQTHETTQTQTTTLYVSVHNRNYPGGSESVPVVTLTRVTKTRPDKKELGKNISPPGWETFNPLTGYGNVAMSPVLFSGWVLSSREEDKSGTIWQVKDQYIFQIIRYEL